MYYVILLYLRCFALSNHELQKRKGLNTESAILVQAHNNDCNAFLMPQSTNFDNFFF
jgi:hypothetical protein